MLVRRTDLSPPGATAAAVTSRIRLTTSVLLAPLHTNTALFAKQAASLDRISGGRLVLGLGIGGREDDFAASGLTMAGRGQRFDEQLAEMQRIWAGEGRGDIGPIGPMPARPGGPELILGGSTEASFRHGAWIVSCHPGRLFTRNPAITAMVLAERLAAGYGDDDLFVIGWREELGL